MALSLCAIPALANGPENLILNGDFEAGNTGFISQYTYVSTTGPSALQPPYVYAIGTSPSSYHSAWTNFGDHTNGSGNMMIVNGSSNGLPAEIVWEQTVTLPVCDPVTSYPLFAGQNWEIGEVQVENDTDGKICVKFVLTDVDAIDEGWIITEAHVAVGATYEDIPQKNGNPIPGKFTVNVEIDPGVTETEWYCLDYAWTEGVPLVIAAHVNIERPELGHMETYSFCAKSGAETGLVSGGNAAVSSVNPWGTAVPNSVNDITGCTEVAEWIWDPARETSYYADNGDLVEFVQSFNITGTPTTATLKIAADNSFAYSLNGGIEVDENLAEGWRDQAVSGNFAPTSPNPLGETVVVIDPNQSGWGDVYTYDVLSSLLSGANTLNVAGINADWNTTSWSVNPGAVIFKLCGTSEQYVIDIPCNSETGWGGTSDFPGKNWATYINYTPTVCSTSYLLEFYAVSSYPTAPAILEVQINDVVVGAVLNLTSTPGEWVKYSESWDAGAATMAKIQIRDLRDTYSGDDFCIDDIFFVQQ